MFFPLFSSIFRKSLVLWQLTNGHSFIQIIYSRDDDSLADCEYLTEPKFVRKFITKFHDEVYQAETVRNMSTKLKSYYEPESKHLARKFRHYLNNHNNDDVHMENENSGTDAFGMRNITYHRIFTESDIPIDLLNIINVDELKHQCDERHNQMQKILSDLNSDDHTERRNATNHLSR